MMADARVALLVTVAFAVLAMLRTIDAVLVAVAVSAAKACFTVASVAELVTVADRALRKMAAGASVAVTVAFAVTAFAMLRTIDAVLVAVAEADLPVRLTIEAVAADSVSDMIFPTVRRTVAVLVAVAVMACGFVVPATTGVGSTHIGPPSRGYDAKCRSGTFGTPLIAAKALH